MKTYRFKVEFTQTYEILAKNSEDANNKIKDVIDVDEFAMSGSPEIEYYGVEDEPIKCPDYKGEGTIPQLSTNREDDLYDMCPRCKGDGEIIPEEYFDEPFHV